MYIDKQFRILQMDEILADIEEAAGSPYASYIDRVFLAGTLNAGIPAMRKVLDEVDRGDRYAREMGAVEIL